MSNICMVTGKKPSFGKKVSFSHKRSNRRWTPNIQKKRYWIPSQRLRDPDLEHQGDQDHRQEGHRGGHRRHAPPGDKGLIDTPGAQMSSCGLVEGGSVGPGGVFV